MTQTPDPIREATDAALKADQLAAAEQLMTDPRQTRGHSELLPEALTEAELAATLLERIAEDAEAARRASFGYGAKWISVTDNAEDWSVVHADGKRDMVGCEDRDVTRHIARHDPARVLARCAADRALVEAITGRKHEVVDGDCWYTCQAATEERDGGTTCRDERGACDCGRDKAVREQLELLAAPYRIGG